MHSRFNESNTFLNREDITEPEVWLIDSNSGPQFLVVGENQVIRIYQIPDEISRYCHDSTNSNQTQHWELLSKCFESQDLQLVYTIDNFEGVWSGYDPSEYHYHFRSVLIKISEGRYILVSNGQITEYNPDEEIYDFMAYVGPNNVIYPFMWSENKIYYMTIPASWVWKDSFPMNINLNTAAQIFNCDLIGGLKAEHEYPAMLHYTIPKD